MLSGIIAVGEVSTHLFSLLRLRTLDEELTESWSRIASPAILGSNSGGASSYSTLESQCVNCQPFGVGSLLFVPTTVGRRNGPLVDLDQQRYLGCPNEA